MSRKRKPNRKRQGGRVTPPKQAQGTSGAGAVPPDLDLWADAAGPGERWTDPGKLGDGGSDLEPDVHSVFSAMAEAIESRRETHPAEAEELASEFVSIMAMAAAGADDEDEFGGAPPGPDDRVRGLEMVSVAVSLLAEAERVRPRAAYIDCLRSLVPFVDAAAADDIRSALDRADGRTTPPAWADAIWQATPVGAWRAGDLLGDSLNLGIELAWPGEWENRVLFGSLILTEGPFVNDLVLATLDEFTEVYTPGTGYLVGPGDRPYLADTIRYLEPADVGETARTLSDGIAIAGADADAPLQPGFDSLAPLAGLVLDTITLAPPADVTRSSDAQRADAATAFLASPEAAGLADEDSGVDGDTGEAEVRELVERFFDYVEQRSDGDAHRWSPAVVAAFLDWYLRTEIASDEDDEALTRVVEAWIRYAHRLKGWPGSITDEALLRLETHLNPDVDPAELWEQSLSDGIEAMADELGFDLGDDDSMFPLFDALDTAVDSGDDSGAPTGG
ncbi:MAG: hypothetical protein IPN02_12735 [Candidatus Microthrix sp.]|uniref:Uncharacterized protein n=1 Tax=Candidatus Neomicrothrix subdominans TaxID=2954438 RepID=A0A936NCX5_9ACTN|nr:hypothetical protein [Candidatus Microthrix subdominans]